MTKKAELVFVPASAMGHLVPAIELAKLLLDVNHDLYITLLFIKPHNPKLDAYVNSFASNPNTNTNTNSRLKFVELPDSSDHVGAEISLFQSLFNLYQTQRFHVKEVVRKMVCYSESHPNSPRLAGFVIDFCLAPMIEYLATEFGVPSYIFYSSGAASLGLNFFLHQQLQNIKFNELKDLDVEFNLPFFAKPVPFKFFPTVLVELHACPVGERMDKGLREAKGILINTFSELESHAVDSLSLGKNPPLYPVGPILNLNNSNSDVMNWLDKQPSSSVVFLSFGSTGSFGKDQVREIACALDQSGYRFIWSLRKLSDPINLEDALPEGFLNRNSRAGMIIEWAPQVAILGHPAVGGFVSHCGWNSILESIWFGVPIATWPLHSEQQLNAFQLVMELGLGVEIKMDYRKELFFNTDEEIKIVSAEKIELGIKRLMEHDSDFRKRTKEMRERSRKALVNGGSSHSALCHFLDDVMQNLQ